MSQRQRIGFVFVLVFLFLTGVLGTWNGLREWGDATSRLQHLAVATELAYGVLGILGAFALQARRSWTVPVLLGWGGALTATGGLAPVAWGGAGLGAGLAAGVATALIAALVVWPARRALESRHASRSA